MHSLSSTCLPTGRLADKPAGYCKFDKASIFLTLSEDRYTRDRVRDGCERLWAVFFPNLFFNLEGFVRLDVALEDEDWSIYGFQPVLDIFNNHGINCAF